MTIAETIRHLRARYIADGDAASYYAINNGLCAEFADDVIELLGGYSDHLCEYGPENFMMGIDGDPFENHVWDWALLSKHWGISPPVGLNREEMDCIAFGGHIWISDGNLHYDAECPDGVASFFDLPLFRRYIVRTLREKGLPAEDVVTDDVVPSPVPNPRVKKLRRDAALGM